MTRKQAVLDAIKILSKKKENEQTVKILREIYDELPICLLYTSDAADEL